MAIVTTRTELEEYCLRKLGSPVIDINVADEQIDDRIDDIIHSTIQNIYQSTI